MSHCVVSSSPFKPPTKTTKIKKIEKVKSKSGERRRNPGKTLRAYSADPQRWAPGLQILIDFIIFSLYFSLYNFYYF